MRPPRKTGKQVILRGGRKPIEVEFLKQKKFLGGDYEGKVYEIKAIIGRGKRKRKITLATKEFYCPEWTDNKPFGNPIKQFETMQGLLKLNREKKLGLRIIPTIRLLEEEGKRSLIITKLNVIDQSTLVFTQQKKFWKDMNRQTEILQRNGYSADYGTFKAILDKKSKKIVAAIVDFGHIKKIH